MPIILPSEQGNVPLSLVQGEKLFSSRFRAPASLVIANDVLTVDGYGWYRCDTQGAAATDQITSIVSLLSHVGDEILLQCVSAARVVTLVHGTLIRLANSQDFVFRHPRYSIQLKDEGAGIWYEIGGRCNVS